MIFDWLKRNKSAPEPDKSAGKVTNPPGSGHHSDGLVENAVALSAGLEMVDAYYPGRDPIEAYGNGGFRFGDMSHQGALMFLPSGIHRWDVASFDDIRPDSLNKLFSEASDIEIVLVGTGKTIQKLDMEIVSSVRAKGIKLDVMDTGAAVRTLNILLSEDRAVAAALLPVD